MHQSIPRAVSQDSTESIRKRVCKACDRCRLKKSKCDGANPCSRCKADNAICVFGERKKSHDKVYPKGYVEMLEQQQSQLVSGLQEMYRRLNIANAWTGTALSEANGHPLTHDILAALDLLEVKQDSKDEVELFEEDTQKLQERLLSEGSGYVQRRGSFSSDSDHKPSLYHTHSVSHITTPVTQPSIFRDEFSFAPPASSPIEQSTTEMETGNSATPSFAVQPPLHMASYQQHRFLARSHHPQSPLSNESSPLSNDSSLFSNESSPLSNDPQLYQTNWALQQQQQQQYQQYQRHHHHHHHQQQQQQRQPQRQLSSAHDSIQHSHQTHRPSILHHLEQRPKLSLAHPVHVMSPQDMLHWYRQQPSHVTSEPSIFETGMSPGFSDTFSPEIQMGGYGSGPLQDAAIDFGIDPTYISVTT